MDAFTNCAQCRLPIRLDSSLHGSSVLQTASYDMLASQQQESLAAQLQSRVGKSPNTANASRRVVGRRTDGHESFIVLAGEGDGEGQSKPNLSSALATSQALHGILDNRQPTIDHPLCVDCADQLQAQMTRQLDQIKAERDRYLQYEKTVIAQTPTAEEMARLKEELRDLREEEERVKEELAQVAKEQAILDKQSAELAAEEALLDDEEEEFWADYTQYRTNLSQLEAESAHLQQCHDRDANELAKLQKTNVYNDAFCIGHEGGIATINGLRLGRLPSQQVDWPEINAAWGHTVLLTHTIARIWNLTFETYRLIPMASFSKIEKLSDNSIMELYGSGEFAIGRMLLNRRFEHAMVAFLDCLKQLMAVAKTREPSLRLPFSVNKDKIGEVSIKVQFSSDETWTRALRHVLLTLKMLLLKASTESSL